MNDDYLLIRDMDDRPCVTATKEAIASRISGLSWDRVVVVPQEIEAWYLAGLNEAACGELGLGRVADVDSITKEHFDQLVGGRRQHQPTMDEILKRYDVEVARQRSPSFRILLAETRRVGRTRTIRRAGPRGLGYRRGPPPQSWLGLCLLRPPR